MRRSAIVFALLAICLLAGLACGTAGQGNPPTTTIPGEPVTETSAPAAEQGDAQRGEQGDEQEPGQGKHKDKGNKGKHKGWDGD